MTRFKDISDLEIKQDYISVFGSGHSISKLKSYQINKIYRNSFCIWLNFAPIKYNKYIDCLIWMDFKLSIWLDKFYAKRKRWPFFWTRDMAFYKHRNLKLKKHINFYFDDECERLADKTNLTIIYCLMELQRVFPDKKILLFGIDLDGRVGKWYDKYIKKGDDNWKHGEDQSVDLLDCERDLKKYIKRRNIINCNIDSGLDYFEKGKWENELIHNNNLYIQGPSGFGDHIYSIPIIEHFTKKDFNVIALARYPDCFKHLKCITKPYFYFEKDIDFSYIDRKYHKNTTQFQDMCIMAGIRKRIPFEIKFNKTYKFKTRKKICIIQKPYWPMNELEKRHDLVPDYRIIQKLIDLNRDYYYIQIGPENSMRIDFNGIDEYFSELPFDDLMCVINSSDMIITQIGWTIAAAEILNKKVFVIFSARGKRSKEWFFRTITPQKVITKKTSQFCYDNSQFRYILSRFGKFKNDKN